MGKDRILKLFMSLSLLAGLIDPNLVVNVSATTDNQEVVQNDENKLQEGRAATYEYKPWSLDEGHDGYSYVKVGTAIDPYTNRDVYQMWSYEFGHRSQGWTAYVAKGSRTLMLTGNLDSRSTLGVGSTTLATETYKPAVFDGDTYTGEIIYMDGSFRQSILLTTTGEMWYTGLNTSFIFNPNASNSLNSNVWKKYTLPAGYSKVIDAVLVDDTLFYVAQKSDGSGDTALFLSGRIAVNNSVANSNTAGQERYLKTNYPSNYQFNLDITNELNGEKPLRVFSQRATEDDMQLERWLIVGTDAGYLGSGYTGDTRKATGIFRESGNITSNSVETRLRSRDYLGFNPVMYQVKPAGLPEVMTEADTPAAGSATPVRLPAGYVKVAQSQGEELIVNFVGNEGTPLEGKIFSSGRSVWGNVTGSQYRTFQGWDNSNSNFTQNILQVGESVVMNSWDTGFFAENDAWGDNNDYIYPGILSMQVRKKDGELYIASEIGAAAGTVPANNIFGTSTNYAYECLDSQAWCYISGIIPIESPALDPYFVSTTWDKREQLKRGYTISLWNGAMTVDQDDLLRIAPRRNSYGATAAQNQLIFPHVTPDSTIRTVTTTHPDRTDAQYIQYNYNNQIAANRNNVRVVGEFMIVDQVHVDDPNFVFDGPKDANDVHANVNDLVDNTYNPYNITVGEPYSRKYTLNSDKSPSNNAQFYLDYLIRKYDPDNMEYDTTLYTSTNNDITDNPVNVDLSAYAPGWYQIAAYRHTTVDGVKYESSTARSLFYVPVEIVMEAPTVTITPTNLNTNIADTVEALIRPTTSLNSQIYIESSTINLTDLGTVSTGTVNQATGTATKNTNVTVSAINDQNLGVHKITYRVYDSQGNTATIVQTVIVNDGTLVVGDDYIIKANDYKIAYKDYTDTDIDLKTLANVKLWEKDSNGNFVPKSDLSDIIVNKATWSQQEGLSTTISFSINKKDGSGVDVTKDVTGEIDSKPVITFNSNPLKIPAADIGVANVLKRDMTITDADGDTVNVTTTPTNASGFVSGTIYNVTYTATDSRGNVTTATRTAFIDDGKLVAGSKYIIKADSFSLRVSEVADAATRDAQVIDKSNVVIYDLEGNEVTNNSGILDIRYGTPAYDAAVNAYDIKLVALDGATDDVDIDIIASVVSGQSPVVGGTSFVEVSESNLGTYDFTAGITLSDDFTAEATLKTNLVATPVIGATTSPGVYKVQYTTTDEDNNTSNVFDRVVLVNNGKYKAGNTHIIYADDFHILLSNANVSTVLSDAGVAVYDKTTGNSETVSGNVTINYGTPDYSSVNAAGSYPITFTHNTDLTATRSITGNVYDEPAVIGDEYIIAANNFEINLSEVAAYTDSNNSDILIASSASANKLSDGSAGTVEVSSNGILNAIGSYPVVLKVSEEVSTTITIIVTVKDDNTVVGDEYALSANNFTIDIADAADYMDSNTSDVLGNLGANATAWKKSDNTAAISEVVSNGILAEVGVYPVTIRVQNEPTTTKTVYVTVKGDKGVVTGDGKYLIVAQDFVVDLTQGDVLPTSQTEMKTSASVKVYDTATGLEVTDQTVTAAPENLVGYSDGLYNITFTLTNATNDAVVTISAMIIDDDTGIGVVTPDTFAIFADNFIIDKRSTNANYNSTDYDSSSKIAAFANAKIVNKTTMAEDSSKLVVTNPSDFTTQSAGKYQTTYTIQGETVSTTADVYIIDDSSTVDGDIVVNGNNFQITNLVAKTLTQSEFISHSSAYAFNLDNGDIYTVSVSSTDLALVNTGVEGVYPVVIKARGHANATKTIYVTVTGDKGVTTGDDSFILTARDFTIDLRTGETLPTSLNDFVDVANAKITNTQTGDVLTNLTGLSVSPSSMNNYRDGIYDVKFTYAHASGNAEVTVKALVIKDSTGIVTIGDQEYAIFASNFVIDKRSTNANYNSADYDTSAEIVTLANAKAYNTETYLEYTGAPVIANPASFVSQTAGKYETKYSIQGAPVTSLSSATALVFVMDDKTIVDPGGLAININADNISLTVARAMQVTGEDILEMSHAHAFDSNTGEEYDLEVDTADLAAINTGVEDVYTTKLNVIGESFYGTIAVTVTGNNGVLTGDGAYLLKASDFTVDLTQGDLLPVNIGDMISVANVSVTRTSDAQVLTDLSDIIAIPTDMIDYRDGLYNIAFSYPSDDPTKADAEKYVLSLVIDDNTGTGTHGTTDYAVVAQNILIDKTSPTYNGSDYDTSDELIEKADAQAIDVDTKLVDSTISLVSNPADYSSYDAGIYISKYIVSGSSPEIASKGKVMIIDRTSTKGPDKIVVNGKNFEVDSATASTMTKEDVITTSKANAFNSELISERDVTISDADLATINAAVSGVYPIKILVDGSTTTKTIYVTITDENGVVTGDGKYLINAYNFKVDLTNGDTLPTTNASVIAMGDVKVTNTQNGQNVVNLSNVAANPNTMAGYNGGLYDVNYTLTDPSGDASVTIKALVIDDNTGTGIIGSENFAIFANDFSIDKRSGSGYNATDYDTSDEIAVFANSYIVNVDTLEKDSTKTIDTVPSSFATQGAGKYETTYTINGETIETKANVYIYDDTTTIDVNNVAIDGDNFTVNSTDARLLDAAGVVTKSNAYAFNISDNTVYDVEVNNIDLTLVKTGVTGVYPVKLTASGFATPVRTIYVTVTDDDGVVTGDGEHLLTGESFIIDLTQGDTLPTNLNEFVANANIKIIETSSGTVLTNLTGLSVTPTTMTGYSDGVYSVTFTYNNGSNPAVLNVNAIVIDDNTGTGTIGVTDYAVIANDIFIDKTDSGYNSSDYDTSAELVTLSKAVVVNLDTKEIDATKAINSTPASYVSEVAGKYTSTYEIVGQSPQIAAKANVYITDDTSTQGASGEVINGNNFTVNQTAAQAIDSNGVITNSSAHAYNKNTFDIYDLDVDATDLTTVQAGNVGVFPVKLTISGTTTPVRTIYVTVTGDKGVTTGDGKYLLVAENFVVDLTQGDLLPTNMSEISTKANVKVYDTDTGLEVTNQTITTAPTSMSGYTDGLYDVTITLSNTTSDAVVSVKALVVNDDSGTGTSGGTNYVIVTANNFTIDKRSGSGYNATDYDTSAELVSLAGALVINRDTFEIDTTKTVLTNPTSYATQGSGKYPTSYFINGDTGNIETIGYVYIIDDTSVVGSDDVVINGNSFTVTSLQATALTDASLVTTSNAHAFNLTTTEELDIIVDTADLTAVKTGVPGVYPVKLKVSGSNTVKTIYVTVTGDKGVVTGDGKYLLVADDFTIDLTSGDVLPTSETAIITEANVKVYDTETGLVVSGQTITTSPTTMVGYSDGIYDITITLDNTTADAVLVVKAIVIDDTTGIGTIGDNYIVTANNFVIDKRAGSGYVATDYDTSAEIVAKANALAINSDTYEIDTTKTLSTTPSSFATQSAGEYETTYSTTGDTGNIETKAVVYVVDDTSGIGTDDVAINGNNFTITSAVAASLSATDVIDTSNAHAFNLLTGMSKTVNVNSTDLANVNNGVAGVYAVRLEVTGSDAVKTIYITVTDDNGVITGDGKYLLLAYNYTIDLTNGDVLPTSEAAIQTEAQVKVINTETGAQVNNQTVTTNPTSMAGYVDGIYDVVVTLENTTNDAVITVKAIVIDDNTGTGTSSGVNYAVVANNFVIDKRTGSGYVSTNYNSSAKLVAHAGAHAINVDDYLKDPSKNISSAPLSYVIQGAGKYTSKYYFNGDTGLIEALGKVYIITDTTGVGTDDIAIDGKNFTIQSNQATTLTANQLLTRAQAYAFDINTTEEKTITVDSTDLLMITSGITGIFPVSLTVAGSDAVKTIYVTVTGDDGVVTGDGRYLLNAYDFIVDLTQGDILPPTETEIADYANVIITDTSTGLVVEDKTVTIVPGSMVGYRDGIYDFAITLEDPSGDAVINVTGIVIDDNTGIGVVGGVEYAVFAHKFVIDKRTGSGYTVTDYDTSAEIIAGAEAIAVNLNTFERDITKTITTNPTSFATQTEGKYPTTYSIQGDNGPIVTNSTVYVLGDKNIVGTNDYAIYGDNFTTTVEGAVNLTSESATEKANAHAYHIPTGTPHDIILNGIQFSLIQVSFEGVYPLKLSLRREPEPTKTIYVTITGDHGVVTGDGKYLLTADDFVVDLTAGDTLPTTEALISALSNVKVTDTSNGQVVNTETVTILPTTMAGYRDGVYDIEVTLHNSNGNAVVTVKGLVIDDDTGVGPIDTIEHALFANNFVIDKRSGSGYNDVDHDTSSEIISSAKATVYNKETVDYNATATAVIQTDRTTFVGKGAGEYKTKYFYNENAEYLETHANVYILDDTTTVGSNDVAINGNNFSITSANAVTLTDVSLLTNATAHAFNIITAEPLTINVNPSDLSNITAGNVGVYPVELSVNGSTAVRTIYVTVTGDNGVLTGDGEYLIVAENFTVDLTAGDTLPTLDTQIMTLANVKVYDTSNGQVVSGQTVDVLPNSMADYSDGLYDIAFTLNNSSGDASVSVKALVIDDNSGTGPVSGEDYVVIANDFIIDKRSGSGYNSTDYDTSAEIVDKSGAIVVNEATKEIDNTKVITTNPNSFVSQGPGKYLTTYSTVGDSGNLDASANVYVIDDTSVISGTEVIDGSNFSITSANAKLITTTDFITNSNAYAFDISTTQELGVTVNLIDLVNVKTGIAGTYPVRISVTNGSAVKTIYVTVTSDNGVITGDGEYLLTAYDFTIDLTNGDVLPTDDSQIKSHASVKVTKTSNGQIVSDQTVVVSPSTMAGYSDGVYDITVTLNNSGGDAVVIVKALVIDDNTGTGVVGGKDYIVVANDFVIDKRSGSGYAITDYDTSSEIVTAANAIAINKETKEEDNTITVSSLPTSFATQTAGKYPTTYSIVGDTGNIDASAIVYVLDDSSAIGTDNVVVNGNNFTVTDAVAKTLTSTNVIDRASAHAFDLNTADVRDVVVDSADLAQVNTGDAGVYLVKLTVPGSDVVKNIYVTVTGDNGVVTGDGEYLLLANDFTIDLTQGDVLPTTDLQIKTLANVEVIDTSNGQIVTGQAIVVNPSTMSGYSDGLYDVTFTLNNVAGDAIVSVKALVIDDNTGTGVVGGENFVVVANNFVIDKRTGSGYTSTDFDTVYEIVAGANAVAINANTREEDQTKAVTSNPTSFVTQTAGEYLTTYSIVGDNGDIETTAIVYVLDDTSVVGTSNIAVNGNNFSIPSSVAQTLTDSDVIDRASAHAFDLTSGDAKDVVVNSTDLAAVNTGVAGIYPVRIADAGGNASKTIYVTVTSDNGVVTGNEEYLLTGYGFVIDLTQGDVLPTTEALIAAEANVRVMRTSDGVVVNDQTVTITPTTMAGYSEGIYDITITLHNVSGDAVLTVKAIVIDDDTGTGVVGGDNYAVFAKDFVIDKRAGSGYNSTDFDTSSKIAQAASATVLNVDTHTVDTTKIISTNPTSFVSHTAGEYPTIYSIVGDIGNIEKTATVYVLDDTSVVGTNDVAINGNNFSVTDVVARTLSANDIIDNSLAHAFNINTAEKLNVIVDQTDLATINNGNVGTYPVKLTVSGSDALKTVYVTITGDNGVVTGNGDYLLTANDFVIDLTQGDVLPTNESAIKNSANITVINTSNGQEVTDQTVTITPTSMSGYSDGVYNITITLHNVSGDAVVVVKALVIDDNTGTGVIGGVDYVVIADDFVIDKRTGSSYVSTDYDTSAKIVAGARAQAIIKDTFVADVSKTIDATPNSFVTQTAGKYETEYTINGVSPAITAKANVFVIDDTTAVGIDSYAINGNNFEVTSTIASSLTNSDIITNSNANAVNLTTGQEVGVIVNASELATIKTGVVGVYPLSLGVNGSNTVKTIYVTVTGDGGVTTGNGDYLLTASDFIIDLTQGDVLPSTDYAIGTHANVTVTDTSNGQVVTTQTVTISPNSMTGYADGIYNITITLHNPTGDAVVNVKAVVIDDDTGTGVVGGENFIVTANNFVIDKRSGSSYIANDYDTSNEIVALANAVAINKDTFAVDITKTIISNPSSFVSQGAGKYDVTYELAGSNIMAKANVFVIEDSTSVGTDNIAINGNNFEVNKQSAKTLTSAQVIDKSLANAVDLSTNEEKVVVVDVNDLNAVNTGVAGVYPVKLGVSGSNTIKTIFVTVTGDNGVVTGDGKYLLTAENFVVDLTAGDVLPTNEAAMSVLANVVVTETKTGVVVTNPTISISPSSMTGYSEGIYDIKVTLPNANGDAVVNVKAIVIDDNTGIEIVGGVKKLVVSDDFIINKSSPGYNKSDYDTIDELKALANVRVINLTTFEIESANHVTVSNMNSLLSYLDTNNVGVLPLTFNSANTVKDSTSNVTVTMNSGYKLDGIAGIAHIDKVNSANYVDIFKLQVNKLFTGTTDLNYNVNNAVFTINGNPIKDLGLGVYTVKVVLGDLMVELPLVVVNDKTVVDNNIVLYVDEYYIKVKDVDAKNMTFDDIIRLTNARAFDLTTGRSVNLRTLTPNVVNTISTGKVGLYKVSIKANPEAIVTVEVVSTLTTTGITYYLMYFILLLFVLFTVRFITKKYSK